MVQKWLMKQKFLHVLLCLFLLLGLLPGSARAEDDSRIYQLALSVDGETKVQSGTEETVTVTVKLLRTDSTERADMYGMQTEIYYDDSFLQLVEDSVSTASGIEWTDMARRTGGRAIYLNFVSFTGGEAWEAEKQIGSFQMKVLGTSGVSKLVPENSKVSTQDGTDTFAMESQELSVIVSTDCTVSFDSAGGTEVPDQTVQYGETVTEPEDPVREGYHLEGWYADLDHTQQWDFEEDTVTGNMTLYAGWAEGNPTAAFPWWIILIPAAVVVVLLILWFRKRKSRSAAE